MIYDTNRIKFTVEKDNQVFLYIGGVGMSVCDSPEEFKEFAESLSKTMSVIEKEMLEYCDDKKS